MHNHFNDIARRISDPVQWYDQNGVPRYDKFTPDDVPNIYASEALLVEIRCQDCHTRFMVGLSFCDMDKIFNPRASSYDEDIKNYLKEKDKTRYWFPVHYGDPPNHGCVGDTMNCEDLRIVEFWKKDRKSFGWVRVPEYEIVNDKEEQ